MKIKTKEELAAFLHRSFTKYPRVRRYNKSTKTMEHFWIVSIEPGETSAYEVTNEPVFNLVKVERYGPSTPRIQVDFYTLISSFDFMQ
jgi:hypothetical protein